MLVLSDTVILQSDGERKGQSEVEVRKSETSFFFNADCMNAWGTLNIMTKHLRLIQLNEVNSIQQLSSE